MKGVKCPGIEIRGLHTTVLPSISSPSGHKIFKRHVFTPFFSKEVIPVTENMVARAFDIVLQQRKIRDINVLELCPDAAQSIAGLYMEGVDFEETVLVRKPPACRSTELKSFRPLGNVISNIFSPEFKS